MKGYVLIIAAVTVFQFALTALLLKKIIPILKSRKMGQKILEIGPRWHKDKEGTPTMGGISFIAASVITLLIFVIVFLAFKVSGNEFATGIKLGKIALTFFLAVANGATGVLDDMRKLKKHTNEGLTAPQKFGLQILIAAVYIALMRILGYITTDVPLPFTGVSLHLGVFYYPVAVLLIAGVVNAVNITDGIDGLASSVTGIVGIFFTAVSVIVRLPELTFSAALITGSSAGFLVYNFYPARVFMGDTGSLYLGGFVVGCAFLCGQPLIALLAGVVYLIEVLSVMLQVSFFKMTHGKRLFKMAPIHHHFEKCGWSELNIVFAASVLTAAACAGALISFII